ncbi:carboxylating nicotinate-nucleotide diphosphorylase [Pedococcus bigeumensis]|uniref:Nicotinate-nucleotide pyrophosphorylase [carboxylating] n=1 Tax=Pedococcus bigeumensis TaxID=433644 RepID=A0A502CQ40_9MICO|nr:carboxylating nicotinate-nucleotide diphosphorylase [Pedococcus bigeumensis]TPG14862.1 carboxylating nicotinate-nucleotide diphosphorylase [Pedococcus bigeumensis]
MTDPHATDLRAAELEFPEADALAVIRTALDEDLGGPDGVDVTTMATIPADQVSSAQVVAREAGALAGIPVIAMVFDEVARRLGAEPLGTTTKHRDGDVVSKGDVVATLSGSTQVTLVGERTMLNIVCRLSGIATHTYAWAQRLEGTGATVLDTRKTTPGLRALEKYAVRAGGGTNKRMGLYDVAMIKDNHKLAAGSLSKAYAAVLAKFPHVPIQVEVTTTQEALESVEVGARFLLCDNMSPQLLRETVQAVRATGEDVELEATGGLTLQVAREYAETGVDYLSVGGLTHSSPILDLALDLTDG